jgi:two-component system NarL family sensor kinase
MPPEFAPGHETAAKVIFLAITPLILALCASRWRCGTRRLLAEQQRATIQQAYLAARRPSSSTT